MYVFEPLNFRAHNLLLQIMRDMWLQDSSLIHYFFNAMTKSIKTCAQHTDFLLKLEAF